ncbi:pre-mRNA splicing factor ATP-dependent RNA helicase prp2-like protein (nucleomorph) [Chroomonas mesostigmatica CCMP1168]|uniref:Pre-mRNA splicing factor ATP-dependent RNA helicase prp2-like protein n=1 Tax=Chroomonas mesostigmatica CCMP1168 TaxID=1195612 RepID=J7G1C4_9CRYP|nr:pre-mRNA splicing factor ATP-dependent RNA helicase prp2-like protein [Chroomonas mesostigmatica CCMP1168]|mmetsp:Transcript_16783/g.41019  ORF Transcript_16783/g.41019 Transcript_16783/m.41019 type:complete len:620 (+) Transcript_16783:128-1987(+)
MPKNNFPVDIFFDQILESILIFKIIIMIGETGSGKTTRIPHFLYFSGIQETNLICCTQPRRLSTIAVAKRISYIMGKNLGHDVGYTIRFEDCTTEKTKIKIITDGLLTKEWLNNPYLKSYSILILDEIHERSSNTDLILSLCRNLMELRSDLKIVITSATLNAEQYSNFFFCCPVFSIPGRCYSVKIYYSFFQEEDFLTGSYSSLVKILKRTIEGDILVFLTGKDDINIIGNLLFFLKKKLSKEKNFFIIPIFSGLPIQWQTNVLKNCSSERKIILATNIAETSLTIPTISFVVDCGFVKQKIFNPYFSISNLITIPISKNSAVQRAGRSGRTRTGNCIRNYSKWSYKNEMPLNFTPEIQRIDVSFIILFLKGLGTKDFFSFDWIDFPSKIFFYRSLRSLYCLGAFSKNGFITSIGRLIIELSIEPMLAKALISGYKHNCVEGLISIASMLLSSFRSDNTLIFDFCLKKDFCFESDHLFFLNIFNKWQYAEYSLEWCSKRGIEYPKMIYAKNLKTQLLKILKPSNRKWSNKCPTKEGILKSLLHGYVVNLAKIKKERIYRPILSIENLYIQIHPSCILNFSRYFPVLIIFHELFVNPKPFFRFVSGIKKKWVFDFINLN